MSTIRVAPPASGANTTVTVNGRTYSAVGAKAVGQIVFSANPTATHTITLNGTAITFVASGATGSQVNVGSSLAVSIANLLAFIALSTDAGITSMTYSFDGAVLKCVATLPGTAGNSLTIATTVVGATASGSTLAGGTATGGTVDVPAFDADALVAAGWARLFHLETTVSRPTMPTLGFGIGSQRFDTTLNQVITWNGSVWIEPVMGTAI
jgi:hypothetical protein